MIREKEKKGLDRDYIKSMWYIYTHTHTHTHILDFLVGILKMMNKYLKLSFSSFFFFFQGYNNNQNGVAPSPTPWCSSYRKREPLGHPRLWSLTVIVWNLGHCNSISAELGSLPGTWRTPFLEDCQQRPQGIFGTSGLVIFSLCLAPALKKALCHASYRLGDGQIPCPLCWPLLKMCTTTPDYKTAFIFRSA